MKSAYTPVLIVGGGLVGLSAALFMAQHQVPYILIERHTGTSVHPRARGINVRGMELFRQLHLDENIQRAGASMENNFGLLHAKTLLGADFDQMLLPKSSAIQKFTEQIQKISPANGCKCTQDMIEPVLLSAARERGGHLLFHTKLLHIEQKDKGVAATIVDQITGDHATILADYLIAADGANSTVRSILDITMPGRSLGHQMNILFEANLSHLLQDHSFSICNIKNEHTQGTLLTVGNTNRYTYHVSYDPETGKSIQHFTPERCIELVRQAIGISDLDVQIISILPWEAAERVAGHYQQGRVFLVGDAAHVMPPTGGYGGSTGIQDVHNLAWKLGAVIHKQADESLLSTYETERRPIGLFTAQQAGLLADSGILTIMK